MFEESCLINPQMEEGDQRWKKTMKIVRDHLSVIATKNSSYAKTVPKNRRTIDDPWCPSLDEFA